VVISGLTEKNRQLAQEIALIRQEMREAIGRVEEQKKEAKG
jgi:hypothetical protein